MDSLHVSSHHHHQQANNSKTSSRSTSPCRPKSGEHHHHHAPHHAKTLSHGSADSYKSQDGVTSSSSTTQQQHQHQQQLQHQFSSSHHHRHRSPTSNTNNTSNSNNNSSSSNIRGGERGGGVSVVGGDMDDSTHLLSSSSHHRGGVGTDNLDDTGLLEGSGVADSSDYYHSSLISNGSSEHVKQAEDEGDGINARTTAVLETLGNKISRVKDLIKTEQKLRDDNVNEYLKLAANADKQQVQRIKAVFEKKNQKSAQVISQLQKKLDNYQKRVIELETHGVSHRPPREVLRDMGQGLKNVGGNIRDGITGFGGSVMSKPKEFAHLIKNKFGSVDNISQLSRPGTTGSEGSGTGNGGAGSDQGEKSHHHHGSATLPAMLHSTTSQNSMGQQQAAKFPSDEGSECSSVTSESIERYHGRGQESSSHGESFSLKAIIKQLQDTNEEVSRLREKTEASKSLHQEIQDLHSSLQEEKFRNERLEEQINDLTELHQNEVENLKQALADMEEKVQYQSEERLRDIQDMLDHCQTKIQKMEHQALQQQQYVTLEGLDNSNARALVVKLINVLLTVLQVILLLVATVSGIIMPFLRTRDDNCSRSVTTIHENYSEADGSWWKMPNGGKLLMSSLLPSSFYTAQASTRHSFMSSHLSSTSSSSASSDAAAHTKS